jgi:hypothetical protein
VCVWNRNHWKTKNQGGTEREGGREGGRERERERERETRVWGYVYFFLTHCHIHTHTYTHTQTHTHTQSTHVLTFSLWAHFHFSTHFADNTQFTHVSKHLTDTVTHTHTPVIHVSIHIMVLSGHSPTQFSIFILLNFNTTDCGKRVFVSKLLIRCMKRNNLGLQTRSKVPSEYGCVSSPLCFSIYYLR